MIDHALQIGIVTLSVADLERSLTYYQQSIGLALLERDGGTALLGTGSRPLLRLCEIPGALHVQRATGLYHFALRVPTRHDLARVIRHFAETRVPIDGASDHLVSEALYLTDPDNHGIEIYHDRPRETWDVSGQTVRMTVDPLDLPGILRELQSDEPAWSGLPDQTDMGHIHLHVADLAAAEGFYVGVLGFDTTFRMPSALFVSAGGYHHHIGLNIWAGRNIPAPPASAARLVQYEIVLSDTNALRAVVERIEAAGIPMRADGSTWIVSDPSQNTIRLCCAA